MSEARVDVLVLGGGLAGLSAAWHLERLESRLRVLVAEKADRVGGRAGTLEKDGFLFDHTGHLLHLHDPYGKALVERLLKGNLARRERSSWIRSHGAYTRYPFQANTFGLPPRVVEECVVGFLKNRHRPPPLPRAPSFEAWCRAAFGEGIYRHFMRPYNAKLWRLPLERMTTEWQGRFLPTPKPEEVLYGALLDQKKFFGYNTSFLYPVRGGIQSLPDALAAEVEGVRLGCRAASVDLAERVAVLDGLGEVRYERLVTTLPLVDFLDIASPLPAAVRAARRKLTHRTVYNLNLGVARPGVSDKHWIYFPEERFPFYRVGFNTNFSRHVAPPGTSSMYIEVSRRPDEPVDLGALERDCVAGLKACGILRASDRIAARLWIPIRCAYVVYDFERGKALGTIFSHLKSRHVESIGRWGAWKYSFMEEALLDGRRCAERLLGRPEYAGSREQGPLKALK